MRNGVGYKVRDMRLELRVNGGCYVKILDLPIGVMSETELTFFCASWLAGRLKDLHDQENEEFP